jgi:hypothetical protein
MVSRKSNFGAIIHGAGARPEELKMHAIGPFVPFAFDLVRGPTRATARLAPARGATMSASWAANDAVE